MIQRAASDGGAFNIHHSRELAWLAPFVCLGLVALVLWRPWPIFPAPEPSHIFTDAQGANIAISMPFHGVVDGEYDFLIDDPCSGNGLEIGWPKGTRVVRQEPYGPDLSAPFEE